MRTSTRINRRRTSVNSRQSLPAPNGGWNVRDSLADMPSKDAVILDNLVPNVGSVDLRKGYEIHVSGMPGQVQTIMEWSGSAANSKQFSASSSGIYNTTIAGAVGAADITGLTNAKWNWVNFSTAGGDFLVACNGDDEVRNYDGSTWTTPTLTGAPGTPAGSDLINVTVHKERLFFIEKDSMSYWVLNVKSIAGTATEVPLGSFTYKGGHLVAQAGWTIDGGSGLDDMLVTITSEGETLVFQGTDPTDANNWSMIGRFNLGKPAGRKCLEKVAGDLIVLTEDGYVSMAAALKSGRSDPNQAVSDKIRGAVADMMELYRDNFGWQGLLFPKAGLIIVNVPIIEASLYHQHVYSIRTKAWCRFTGLESVSWGMLDSDMYFGDGSGNVYKFWSSDADNGTDIVGDVQQAFSYFKTPGRIKRWNQIRPVFQANANMSPELGMSVDFQINSPSGTASFTADPTSLWDESPWDTTEWAGEGDIKAQWRDVFGVGISGGLRMVVRGNGIALKWHSTDYSFEVGDKF